MKWLATLLFFLSFTIYSQTPVYQYERFVFDGIKVDSVPSGSGFGVKFYSKKYYQTLSGLQLFIMSSSETFNGVSLQFFGPTCRNLNGFSAGLTSWTGRTNGLTIGTYNLAETCNGVTLGAFFNRTNKLNGLSLGLANISDMVNGVATGFVLGIDQLNGLGLGFINKVTGINGTSCSFITVADSNNGASLGFLNVARVNKGLQLGVFNRLTSLFMWQKPNGPFFEANEPPNDNEVVEDFDDSLFITSIVRVKMLSQDSIDYSQPFEPVDSIDMVRDGMMLNIPDMIKGYKYIKVKTVKESPISTPLVGGNIDVQPSQGTNIGVMIGAANESDINRGLQLGLYNDSRTNRGLQIGLINISSTGFFPFIKWW